MTITKKILFILLIFYSKNLLSLDLTLYVNNWLKEIPETYKVHSDHYIYLDKNLSSTLSDILDSNSSFNSVRSGPKGSQTSVFTRGTNSNHTLVTINGSPITDHSTSNGLTDLGLIDTNFASRLHLVDGPMSTLYGSNALGGVIDIQTEKKYRNKFATSYGSRGEWKVSLKNNFGDNKKYSLGINLDKTEGISVYPKGEEKHGFELKSFDFGFQEKFDITELEFLYINSLQNTDLDSSGADDLDYTGETKFNFFQVNSITNLPIGKLNVIFDNSYWDREYINGSEIDNYKSDTNHLKSVYIYKSILFDNVLGYDYTDYSANFENRGSYNSSVDKDAYQNSVFYNADIKLKDNIVISTGYSFNNNSHFEKQNSYRIGAIYKIKNINLFSSYSTAFKNPTLYEMFGADNFGYKGNSELKPELSYSSEIGMSFSNSIIKSELSIYDTYIKDMITYSNSTYTNDFSDSSTMKGFDLRLDIYSKNFSLLNSYAHVHAVDSSNTWLKRRPHDILNSSILFNLGEISIEPKLSFYGNHSDTHSENYSTILIKERTIFNLRAGYKNFDLEINNIFNDTYERPHGYNQGGIDIKIGYSIEY